MKKLLNSWAGGLVIAVALALFMGFQSGGYLHSLVVRNNATVNGTLTVVGTTAFTGDQTLTGDLAVNGGDITSTATTFNLLNATVTTGNLFGASTTTTVGATTARFILDASNGLPRMTIGTAAGTGTGNLFIDSLYIGATLVFDASRNLVNIGTIGSGAITATGAFIGTTGTFSGDLAVNGGDVTATEDTLNLFSATVTHANVLGAATTWNIGAATGTATVNNATLAAKAVTLSSVLTLDDLGSVLALRTIAEGDSVFLRMIVDAADTTLKVYNGTSWITIKDLIP